MVESPRALALEAHDPTSALAYRGCRPRNACHLPGDRQGLGRAPRLLARALVHRCARDLVPRHRLRDRRPVGAALGGDRGRAHGIHVRPSALPVGLVLPGHSPARLRPGRPRRPPGPLAAPAALLPHHDQANDLVRAGVDHRGFPRTRDLLGHHQREGQARPPRQQPADLPEDRSLRVRSSIARSSSASNSWSRPRRSTAASSAPRSRRSPRRPPSSTNSSSKSRASMRRSRSCVASCASSRGRSPATPRR